MASDPEGAEAPSIVMTGVGEATGVPDQLVFSLSVKARGDSVSEALGRGNAISRRVIEALREEGVRSADIQTTGLSIDPQYDYSSDGPPVLLGYGVTQRASVLVRSLTDAGAALSATVEAGVTRFDWAASGCRSATGSCSGRPARRPSRRHGRRSRSTRTPPVAVVWSFA